MDRNRRRLVGVVILSVLVFIILIVIIATVLSSTDTLSESTATGAAAAFRSAGIVPNVLDTVPDSLAVVNISYSNGIILDTVSGRQLAPEEISEQPVNITWPSCQQDKLYTLIMTAPDPDAQADSEERLSSEFRHWLVVNIKLCDISSGQTETPYKGPSPTTGIQQYVFLIYEQLKEITADDIYSFNMPWQAEKFAQVLDLTLVAGNYIKSQRSATE